MKKQNGQALVGGLILLMIVLFFSAYYLYVSEAFFRLYTNTEQANTDRVQETSKYANILNEIAINNQNIIAAITVSEDALLKAFEYSIYLSFHQPYWATYSRSKNSALFSSRLSQDSEDNISNIFKSYSLSTGRGFFIAGALAAKNDSLLKSLPPEISTNFIQSTNVQVHCFAIEVEKRYYKKPGILGLHVLTQKLVHFYLQREKRNQCALEHKIGSINKSMEFSVPNFYSIEKDRVIDYSQVDKLNSPFTMTTMTENSIRYGILYVHPQKKEEFIHSLNFNTTSKSSVHEKKFSVIEIFLSKLNFFKGLNLGNKENLLKSSLTNKFIITHKFIYRRSSITSCSISEDQFLRAFFFPNWTAIGVYK